MLLDTSSATKKNSAVTKTGFFGTIMGSLHFMFDYQMLLQMVLSRCSFIAVIAHVFATSTVPQRCVTVMLLLMSLQIIDAGEAFGMLTVLESTIIPLYRFGRVFYTRHWIRSSTSAHFTNFRCLMYLVVAPGQIQACGSCGIVRSVGQSRRRDCCCGILRFRHA